MEKVWSIIASIDKATIGLIVVTVLHILGVVLLYKNRVALLYEDDVKTTKPVLSMGRIWSWLMFYIACSFWLRFTTGVIPTSTPFPPFLDMMLLACLVYEFAKKGYDVTKVWMMIKGGGRNQNDGFNSYGGGQYGNQYGSNQYGNQYGSSQYGGMNSSGSMLGNPANTGLITPPTPSPVEYHAGHHAPKKAYDDEEDKK